MPPDPASCVSFTQVLLPGSPLLHALLPHAAHLLAFSLWAADPPTVTATTAAGKVDPALALPPRIVLAAHVARIARCGRSQPMLPQRMRLRLLLPGPTPQVVL